jgi:hypothetical protein
MTTPDDQPRPLWGDRDPAGRPDQPPARWGQPETPQWGQGQAGTSQWSQGQPGTPQWSQGQPGEAGYPGQAAPQWGQGQPADPQWGQPGEAGWSAGAGAPPPAPRKRRRGLKITLAVLAVLALLCVGGGLILGLPILKEWPATLRTPDSLAGQPRLSTPELDKSAETISSDLKKQTHAQDTVAAFYGTKDNPEHVFAVVGVTTLILDPKKDLADAFNGASEGEMKFPEIKDVDAGPLGGIMRCGSSAISNVPLTMCGWADHGSLVLGLFFRANVEEASAKLRDVRRTILKR